MKELKKVTAMLGTMLTKEEIEDFMREADVVNIISNYLKYNRELISNFFGRMEMEGWIMMNLSKCCYHIKLNL